MAAAAMAAFCAGGIASAQSPFPSKPVHIFVPYAAGGGVDILARTLGDVVSRQWGQGVVVENRPGAGGVVASQALAAAPPDGYTLIVVASGHATNPFLYEKLPYDTFRDFTPISLLASSPNILLVKADSPFKTVADVIAQARAKRRQCGERDPEPPLQGIPPDSCYFLLRLSHAGAADASPSDADHGYGPDMLTIPPIASSFAPQ